MDIHAYVISELEKRKGQWPKIAKEIGMSYRTLQKVADGTVKNPGIAVIQPIYDYFQSQTA